MKQNHITDPYIFEIFRIDNRNDVIDTDGVAWNSTSVLQRAMMSFQPNLLEPEVLIKVSNESALIRTRIEEMDIEERQSSAVLYAELWNLRSSIKKAIAEPGLMNRTIAIERRSGRLQAVAITDCSIPQHVCIDLLNKACDDKGYKKRSLFHLTCDSQQPSISSIETGEESIHNLLLSIKSYLEQQRNPDRLAAGKNPSRVMPVAEGLVQRPLPAVQAKPVDRLGHPTPSEFNNPKMMTEIDGRSRVVLSKFKNKKDGLEKKAGKRELPLVESDEGDIDWLNSGQQMNWKQKKHKDRIILDLAEQTFKLLKKKNTPTREMIISFLASLSGLQLEFMEDLVDCLKSPPETPPQKNQGLASAEKPTLQKRLDDAGKDQNTPSPVVGEKTMLPKPEKAEPRKLPENGAKVEFQAATSEEGEYSDVSNEEMVLHQKILETQKKYNISYDHAAGMVLK